jgi:hypothetical protein
MKYSEVSFGNYKREFTLESNSGSQEQRYLMMKLEIEVTEIVTDDVMQWI